MEKKLWDRSVNLHEGFDQNTIELLLKKENSCKLVPRLYWTTEVYSLGKAYRNWLNLPKCLPLPFYGDHGYCALSEFQNHEIKNRANIHVTFNKFRYEKIVDKYKKKILYIPNPWINWRRKNNISLKSDRKGTLVFYSHSITNIDVIDYDYEKYFNQLRGLPEEFHPLIFMFHINDIYKGYHKFIEEKGFSYLTAGNQNSDLFIDRFYEIAKNFKFATSNTGGSELFYCEELGLDYFIYGEEPIFYNKGHKENPLGKLNKVDELQMELNEYKRKLFSYDRLNKLGEEKAEFVINSLGLNSEITSQIFRKHVLKELIKQLPIYVGVQLEKIINR